MSVPIETGTFTEPFAHHDGEATALAQGALTDVIWLRNATLATEFETPRPFTGEQERQIIYGRLARVARRMGALGMNDADAMEDAGAVYEQLDTHVGVARVARSLFEQVDPNTDDGGQLVVLGRALRNRRAVAAPIETHLRKIHEDSLELTSPTAIAAITSYFQGYPRSRRNYAASVSEANGFSVADILVRAKPLVWDALYGFALPTPEVRVALDTLEPSRPVRLLQRLMDAVTYAYLSISE